MSDSCHFVHQSERTCSEGSAVSAFRRCRVSLLRCCSAAVRGVQQLSLMRTDRRALKGAYILDLCGTLHAGMIQHQRKIIASGTIDQIFPSILEGALFHACAGRVASVPTTTTSHLFGGETIDRCVLRVTIRLGRLVDRSGGVWTDQVFSHVNFARVV